MRFGMLTPCKAALRTPYPVPRTPVVRNPQSAIGRPVEAPSRAQDAHARAFEATEENKHAITAFTVSPFPDHSSTVGLISDGVKGR